MSKYFKPTRYAVMAKRRGENEPWSDWTAVNNYYRAIQHTVKAENAGYDAKMVIKDDAVKELWEILGKKDLDVREQADAILNAGFCKQSEVAKKIFADMRKEIFEAMKSNRFAIEEHQEEHEDVVDDFIIRCEGKMDALRGIDGFIDELEKRCLEDGEDEV